MSQYVTRTLMKDTEMFTVKQLYFRVILGFSRVMEVAERRE